MKKDKQLLKIIANETFEAMSSVDIVTPSVYTALFNEKAKAHNFNTDDEIKLSQEILDLECKNLIEMREQNSKNAIQLSASTSKAIAAIKQKDEISLKEALEEAQKLKLEIESLKEAVYKDDLTGAYNRKWLKDKYLNKNDDNFTKSGTIIIADINDFKDVNDSYGHAVGDKVLIFIANNLKRSKGNVLRYGGDEFLILYDDSVELKDAVSYINKVTDGVNHKKLKAKSGEFRVSFSIGIAHFDTGDNFLEILEEADKKMYKNKEEIKRIADEHE